MRSLCAFFRKEWMEQMRTGRIVLFCILFAMLGIMNPAVAKLTPWLMGMLADSYAGSGIVITPVKVTALDSWTQFFKNMPIGLIVFILIESGTLTGEYRKGTLLLSLTKGLERWKVIAAKALMLFILWTLGYWLCTGITYGYSAYFWDNSAARNLTLSLVCWWLFGVWTVALTIFFSAFCSSNTGVLAGVGGVILLAYLLGLFPAANRVMPTLLADGNSLIYGLSEAKAYTGAVIAAAFTGAVCCGASVPIFNRRRL